MANGVPASQREPPPAPDALWGRWQAAGSQECLDELVARYADLVRILAAKAYRHRFSEELEYGDYVQFGMVGLLEAIHRFKPEHGAKFETFATHRVLGAILNGVERLSEKQQQIAVRSRVRAERTQSLTQHAAGQEQGLDPLQRLADLAVGLALGVILDNCGLYLDGEPASGDTPYERAALAELRQRLAMLVGRLPATEKRVIRGHYFQQQQFDHIAAAMGLTKGRVSQIHHAALKRLRMLHEETTQFSSSA